MKYLTSILIAFVFVPATYAQFDQEKKGCGTVGMSEWHQYYLKHKDKIRSDFPEDIVYIPMTIHILGTDEGSGYFPVPNLFRAVCQLNEDFMTSNMQFYIEGEINYIDRTEWYDHENYGPGNDMMSQSNIQNTVNCYIVNNPAGNCGYYSPRGNAVALSKGCIGPSDHTWAHELGHFFSLPHTFVGWEGYDYDGTIPSFIGSDAEKVDGSNCTYAGDGFCDTPPDYLSFRWSCNNEGESSILQVDPNGESFRSDGSLFMSYSNDACAQKFSAEQMVAMQVNLMQRRSNLLVNPAVSPSIEGVISDIQPENGANAQFDNIVLRWNPIENATEYFVRVSRISNLGGLYEFEGFVEDTFVVLPNLLIGKKYYWRIQPFNDFDYCALPTPIFHFYSTETTGTQTLDDGTLLDVFPNPFSNGSALYLDGGEKTNYTTFELVSLRGQWKLAGEVSNGKIYFTNNLEAGAYFLKLGRATGFETTVRLMVQ